MRKKEIAATIRAISSRSVPGGGFSEHPGAPYRADATAWAILALKAMAPIRILWNRRDQNLRRSNSNDGRVCLSQDHPEILADSSGDFCLAWVDRLS